MQIIDKKEIESQDKNEIAQVLFEQFQSASQSQIAETIERLSPDILQSLLEKIQKMNDEINSLKIDAIKNINSKQSIEDKHVERSDYFQSIFGKSSEFEKQKILAQQLQELIYYEQKKRNDLKTHKLIKQIQLYQSNGIDETEIFKQDEEDIHEWAEETKIADQLQPIQNKIQVQQQTSQKQSVKVTNNDFPIYYNRDFQPQRPIIDKTVIKMKDQFLMRLTGHKTTIIEQARLFMLPIPIEFGQIQCSIERKNSGFNKIWPKYYLHLSGHNVIMLESKKLKTSKTPHFRIEIKGSSSSFLQSNQQFYLGKLNSNLSSSEFYMYDYGIKPKDAKTGEIGYLRRQYGTVMYGTVNLPDRIQSKLSVYMPMVDPKINQLFSWPDNDLKKNNIPFEYAQQLIMKAKQQLKKEEQKRNQNQEANIIPQIMLFQSKKTDKGVNYNGRVTQPSKKNFQLSDEFDQQKIYLQFGRNGKNTFNIDVAYPFSLYQAFCVCLSTFDYKISVK